MRALRFDRPPPPSVDERFVVDDDARSLLERVDVDAKRFVVARLDGCREEGAFVPVGRAATSEDVSSFGLGTAVLLAPSMMERICPNPLTPQRVGGASADSASGAAAACLSLLRRRVASLISSTLAWARGCSRCLCEGAAAATP